jgi:mannosyltransferase OCH1-like enzyme
LEALYACSLSSTTLTHFQPRTIEAFLGPRETSYNINNNIIRDCPVSENVTGIPLIIHQSWKTDQLPAKYLRWQATWKRMHPNWEYKLWTDADNLKLVEQDYPWFLKTYNSFKENISRADVVRYMYMHKVTPS